MLCPITPPRGLTLCVDRVAFPDCLAWFDGDPPTGGVPPMMPPLRGEVPRMPVEVGFATKGLPMMPGGRGRLVDGGPWEGVKLGGIERLVVGVLAVGVSGVRAVGGNWGFASPRIGPCGGFLMVLGRSLLPLSGLAASTRVSGWVDGDLDDLVEPAEGVETAGIMAGTLMLPGSNPSPEFSTLTPGEYGLGAVRDIWAVASSALKPVIRSAAWSRNCSCRPSATGEGGGGGAMALP